MARNSDLFDLIRSLSKTEKRYFRLVASIHSKGETRKYERLFDLIDGQEEYDEEAIRRALAGDPLARNLAEAKYYLYNTIIKALHLYHLERSKFAQISLLIHQAEILLERKLYGGFIKTIARAKELSVRYEQWHLTIAILRLEYRMLLLEPDTRTLEQQHERIFAEIEKYFEIHANFLHFWKINSRLDVVNKLIAGPRSPEQLEVYRSALGDSIAMNEKDALSTGARIYYFMNLAMVQEASGELRGALDSYRSVLSIVESSEHWSTPRSLAIVPVLSNICLISMQMADEETFFAHHARLIATIGREPERQSYAAYVVALGRLVDWYNRAGEFEKACEVWEEIEREMERFGGKLLLGFTASSRIAAFYAYFGAGKYAAALEHINAVIDRSTPDVSETLLPLARILALVVHYELDNHELLEYLVHSTERYLKSHDRLYALERVMLRFFRSLLRQQTEAQRRDLFRALHADLTAMADDLYQSQIIETFDLVAWVESTIRGERFAVVVRESFHRTRARHMPGVPEVK